MTYFTNTNDARARANDRTSAAEEDYPEIGAAGLLAMAFFIVGAAAFGAISAWIVV